MTSVVWVDLQPGGGSASETWRAKASSLRGEDEAGAAVERLGGVGGAAEDAGRPGVRALGDVRARERAERRDEALGEHEDARAAA